MRFMMEQSIGIYGVICNIRKCLVIKKLSIYICKLRGGDWLEVIIGSCVSAAVTLIVCMINSKTQNDKTRALMEYKLDELTKRVDKHNSVIDRTYHLEEAVKITQNDIVVANHRIKDLEDFQKEEQKHV